MKRQYPRWTHGYIDQHGKPRFYLRRPGHKKIALPGLPWSPEFMEARDAALKGEGKIEIGAKRTVAGSVNAALVSTNRPRSRPSPRVLRARDVRNWSASAPITATSQSP
jgi:hypothetical protein